MPIYKDRIGGEFLHYARFVIGSVLCGLLIANSVSVYADDQISITSSIVEEVPTSSQESSSSIPDGTETSSIPNESDNSSTSSIPDESNDSSSSSNSEDSSEMETENSQTSSIDDTVSNGDDNFSDSIELIPLQPASPVQSDINDVSRAILDIRATLVFFVFGVIPSLCVCFILYLFFRWIYGLMRSLI